MRRGSKDFSVMYETKKFVKDAKIRELIFNAAHVRAKWRNSNNSFDNYLFRDLHDYSKAFDTLLAIGEFNNPQLPELFTFPYYSPEEDRKSSVFNVDRATAVLKEYAKRFPEIMLAEGVDFSSFTNEQTKEWLKNNVPLWHKDFEDTKLPYLYSMLAGFSETVEIHDQVTRLIYKAIFQAKESRDVLYHNVLELFVDYEFSSRKYPSKKGLQKLKSSYRQIERVRQSIKRLPVVKKKNYLGTDSKFTDEEIEIMLRFAFSQGKSIRPIAEYLLYYENLVKVYEEVQDQDLLRW